MNDRFLRACRRQPVDATPVWFMRQAGRYMADYRALRQRYSLLEICAQPGARGCGHAPAGRRDRSRRGDPVLRSAVPFTPMGLTSTSSKAKGPSVAQPDSHAPTTWNGCMRFEPREALGHVLETIRLLRRELEGRVPLIGFGGAPFTLAAYAIEGGPSTTYARTKAFMYAQPAAWHRLCVALRRHDGRLPRGAGRSRRPGAAGVRLVGGRARPLGLPRVRAAAHDAHLLGARRAPACRSFISASAPPRSSATSPKTAPTSSASTGARTLDESWAVIGHDRAIQGNLDPTLLLGPRERLFAAADDILQSRGGRPGHIFNLGHGVLPTTPLETVQALARHVHEAEPGHVRADLHLAR